jgi:hypothetical protein
LNCMIKVDCMIKVNSKEELKIIVEKVTNSYGTYQLEIPAINSFKCAAAGTMAAEFF